MTKEEKKYFDSLYTKCEFDDECEVCDNPEKGSYAIGLDYWGECDSYICGKCAESTITEKLIQFDKEMEDLAEHIKTLP